MVYNKYINVMRSLQVENDSISKRQHLRFILRGIQISMYLNSAMYFIKKFIFTIQKYKEFNNSMLDHHGNER